MDNQSKVLHFWFKEIGPGKWFSSSKEVDEKITLEFSSLLTKACRGELFNWRGSPQGRLAEIILLDQFSRNIHRATPQAFANDAMALVLAQELVAQKLDLSLSVSERAFAYLPYMHSESLLIHQEALRLFSIPGLEKNLAFEIEHKNIIERFGRYPHRNIILGRISTPDELEFLKTHTGF